jgi:hypothetical protein
MLYSVLQQPAKHAIMMLCAICFHHFVFRLTAEQSFVLVEYKREEEMRRSTEDSWESGAGYAEYETLFTVASKARVGG